MTVRELSICAFPFLCCAAGAVAAVWDDRRRKAHVIPQDFAALTRDHERRTLRTEFAGGVLIGLAFGAGGMLLMVLWFSAGGCP